MILGGIVAKIFGKKTLIFIGVLAAFIAVGGFLYYRLDSVKESLYVARDEIAKVASELEQSEKVVDEFEKELKLREKIIVQREEAHRKNREYAATLEDQLNKEINSNEKLKECLTIDMSDYVNSMSDAPIENSEPNTPD